MVLEFGANAIALQKQVSFCLLLQTWVIKEKKHAPVCVRLLSMITTINLDTMSGDIALQSTYLNKNYTTLLDLPFV